MSSNACFAGQHRREQICGCSLGVRLAHDNGLCRHMSGASLWEQFSSRVRTTSHAITNHPPVFELLHQFARVVERKQKRRPTALAVGRLLSGTDPSSSGWSPLTAAVLVGGANLQSLTCMVD